MPNSSVEINSRLNAQSAPPYFGIKGICVIAHFFQNNRNNTRRQQFDLSAESKFFKVLTVELGFEGLFNHYRSTGFSSGFRNYKPYLQLDWALIKGLTLSMDYEQNYYRSSGGKTKSTYNFLNAQVTIQRARSPW